MFRVIAEDSIREVSGQGMAAFGAKLPFTNMLHSGSKRLPCACSNLHLNLQGNHFGKTLNCVAEVPAVTG